MRLSIRAKQVAGVTSVVGLAVAVLSGLHLSSLARIRLDESRARGELLANAIYHRAREVVVTSKDPRVALRADAGLRSILESSAYSRNVTYAAIADTADVVIAHSDTTRVGQTLRNSGSLTTLLASGPLAQIRAIYSEGGRTLEIRQPLLLEGLAFGSIRIGVSTLLIRRDFNQSLKPAAATALASLVVASMVAMVLAQVMLRPIHVIRSGLTRLGRGEFGVVVNLPQQDEFGELGDFFNTVSARLSAQRPVVEETAYASVVDGLEDGLAVVSPGGDLLFANAPMQATLPADAVTRPLADLLPPSHPYRKAVDETIASRKPYGPVSAFVPPIDGAAGVASGALAEQDRLILTHAIEDRDGRLATIMLVVHNAHHLNQVRSTISYSRKLAALSRLSAGVAHEVKNPLNATVIHLELLRQQLGSMDSPGAAEHLAVITAQMRRLDEVVQGFLKFIRPEDLKLQPTSLGLLVDDLLPIVMAEAQKCGVRVDVDVPSSLPPINADAGMLQQALLNLVLNACQAMPGGGRLRIAGRSVRGGSVEFVCEDTGVGIRPENLDRIFDLYFTTKQEGSGIGLSMVYRTIQLHDGQIEVQSTPGRGTIFRMRLPEARVQEV